MTMIVLYASGSLIFQQKTFLDIIMNLPALIFINEIDDYMGTHIIRYINIHHRQIRKDEDFLMFPYCEYIGTLSNTISNYLMTAWLVVGSLICMIDKVKCLQFEEWYDKKYVQKNYFKDNLPGFWQFIDWLSVILFLPASIFTFLPILGVKILSKFIKEKTPIPILQNESKESATPNEKFVLKTTKKGVRSQTNKRKNT